MDTRTLVFLIDKQKICLAFCKRGMSKGMYNGYGGHVEKNEPINVAAIRETKEESKVIISKIEKVAELTFYFDKVVECIVHVFFCKEWIGDPEETEEMQAPKWFEFDKLPNLPQMWDGDRQWLPIVLSGKKIKGTVVYDQDGKIFKELRCKEMIF